MRNTSPDAVHRKSAAAGRRPHARELTRIRRKEENATMAITLGRDQYGKAETRVVCGSTATASPTISSTTT